ncbi:hypothetical protein [Lentzea sp.]|uniref:hypothetical protein n=1 Tax=Lentzea sp. TaxID=56099 RepID=UPI002ED66CE7
MAADTPKRTGRVGALLAQAGVAIDQLVFSGITFVLQIVAARASNLADFGVFSLVAIVQIGQWYLGRALTAEPLLVSRSAGDDRKLRGAGATSLSFGLLVGAACAIAAIPFTGLARELLLIQAVVAPFTSVLDHSRYVLYAKKRAGVAIALDAAWLVLFGAVAAVWAVVGELTATTTYLVWALAAVPVAIAAVAVTVTPLALGHVREWVRDQRKLIPGFLIDAAYLTLSTWATFGVALVVVGSDGLGLLRKALIPVTALIVLFIGISNALLAHLAGRSAREVVRPPVMIAGLAAVVCGVTAVLLLLLPADLLTAALGTPWELLQPVVMALLAYAFLLTSAQAAMMAAKATGRAWLGPRVRTVEFCLEVGLGAALGVAFGVVGIAVGMATAWLVANAFAWLGLLRGRSND